MSASAILKLQSAGFSTEQVTAIAELIDAQSATKADVEGVEHKLSLQMSEGRSAAKAELDAVEHKLSLQMSEGRSAAKAELDAVEHKLSLQMSEMRSAAKAELDAVDRRLDLKITAIEGRLTLLQWMLGFVLAFQVAFAFKLFGR